MADSHTLLVGSYNCRGYNSSKTAYIKSLLSNCTVLFLQEHWLSEDQLQLLSNVDANFMCAGAAGFDNSDVLSGRPYGGCAILWRSDISAAVDILPTGSRRVFAVRMFNDTLRLLFINVYMPYEKDEETVDDFTDQLAIVESLINNNPDCHVICGGDFNVDFSRDRLHTVILDSFCETTGLNPIIKHQKCEIDYSYNFNMSRFNILDHFLVSGNIFDYSVGCAYVLHEVDNTSDHEPIVLKLAIGIQYLGFIDKIHAPSVSWVKASDADLCDYRSALSENLRRIRFPTDVLLCNDLQCCDLVHLEAINDYAKNITSACVAAAESTIPRACNRQSSDRLPGWSEYVKPVRDKSLFWHRLWLECGRPKTGVVADSMRRSRAAYHYTIKRIKKDEESIVRERVAASILEDRDRNFWSEIKRIRGNKAGTCRTVDGFTDANGIAKLFAIKYRELYTSVPYDRVDMQNILNGLNLTLTDSPITADCIFNLYDIKAAVSRLKAHKRDGSSALSSDHITNAGDDCLIYIACLFTAIVVHGAVPDDLRVCTVVPIPKGRNVNASDSANFRGIALSSIFGKLFDNIVLHRYHDKLMSCDLQFGFKPKSSTNSCTMVLKETMSYYMHNNSPVFCSFLDATKAFDKIHYCKLFKLLIKRELPAHIVRVLVNLYTHNLVRVSWCGLLSEYFLAANGVKQGAVLSPVLFCVYIDDLLLLLSKAGVGCYIGSYFVGALAYADDIVLVAPTAAALRKLLSICEEFAREFCISFNHLKTKCLIAIPNSRRALLEYLDGCIFSIDNRPIENVKSFVHLGHVITSELTDDEDISKQRANFINQVNNTVCYFRKLHSFVLHRLFRSYCTSYYGCELWLLNNCNLQEFCGTWRKSLRKIWKLNQRTHCDLIPLICQCLPLLDEFCRRSLNFVRSCVTHESALTRFIALHGVAYARGYSFLGQNVLFCARRYHCSIDDILYNNSTNSMINMFVGNSVDDNIRFSANFLIELIMLRDNMFKLSNGLTLSAEELDDIIEYVSIN
jgi:Reverse transcriptase (RNA-dependent DNA polymerase)/Endonuclease/Exonuclease/phosphatase family